jgi:hypothetical protein
VGTKKTDTQTSQFDPTSMGQYQGLQGGLGSYLKGNMSNPYGTPQFQFEQQLGTNNARNQNQTGMSQLMQNQTASGMQGGSMNPAAMEMQNNQMRAGTQNTAMQGFMNPTALANQRQQFAAGLSSQYRPLQTGSTNVQQTSGLGTWLPQVAGMAAGIGLAPFTGGMSLLGSLGAMKGGGGGGDSPADVGGSSGTSWAAPGTWGGPGGQSGWIPQGGGYNGIGGGLPPGIIF